MAVRFLTNVDKQAIDEQIDSLSKRPDSSIIVSETPPEDIKALWVDIMDKADDESTIELDATLKKAGAAAEAKATGEAIAELGENFQNLLNAKALFTIETITIDEKIYFYTMDIAEHSVSVKDGTLDPGDGAFYVTIPYSEGMSVSTCQHNGWEQGYPPFVIKTKEGQYIRPSYTNMGTSEVSWLSNYYTTTLTGYDSDTVVYANICIPGTTLDTIKGALETYKHLFYYTMEV